MSREIESTKDKDYREYRISSLLNGKEEHDYKDKLKSIDDEIEVLNKKEESYDFKDSQNKGIERLKNHRYEIAKITSEISLLEIRMNYIQRTISNYESKRSNIDVNTIDDIYKEAESIVPDLSKTLKQTISFHESIITKKVDYISRQLSEFKVCREKQQIELDNLLDDEQSLVKAIFNESHLGGFIVVEKELQDCREERGRFSIIIDEVANEAREINRLEGEISSLRENNKTHMSQLQNNVGIFNKECKEFTRALFKDYALSVNVGTNSSTNELEFSVVNKDKVSGDGAPRAAALAFDMAFVEFVKNAEINLPEFTIQDHLESIDQEKLATLSHLANDKSIQVVISILSDKLQSLDKSFIKDNTVLWLKQSDKFFKLD